MDSLWDIIKKQEETSAEKPFNHHFQNPNLKFSELLSDERIVTSFKNQNPQLFKYINSHPEVFQEMVSYITVEPMEQDTADRKHRYPFVSGEILSIQNSMIYEMFFGIDNDSGEQDNQITQKAWDYKLLDRLLGYVNGASAINPLLTGYCEKVFNNLFHGNRTKLLQYWFDRYSKQYVKLLSNMNICNLAKNIITIQQEQNQELFNEERYNLLKDILATYSKQNEQYRANTIEIFRQIFSKYLMIAHGKQFLALILNSSNEYLRENEDIQQHTLSFIRDLLIKVNLRANQQEIENVIKLPEQFISNLNRCILHAVNQHHQPNNEEYLNQSRTKVTKLGKSRMFLIEAIRELVKINSPQNNERLVENKLCQWLLGLVEQFRFNSILHCAVQNILITLIKGDTRKQLVEKHYLVQQLCTLLQNNDNSLSFGQLCNVFFQLQKSEDEIIINKMKQPKVIEIFEDVVLPRKEKYQFKWAGNITNFKSKPINFAEDDGSVPNLNKQQEQQVAQQKKPKNNEFDFDFSTAKPKSKNTFNPFTTFPGKEQPSEKPSSNDFNFF